MSRHSRLKVVTFCALLGLLAPGRASNEQKNAPNTKMSNDIAVNASIEELATGYLEWDEHHPDAGSSGKRKINMPFVDLYSPSGTSIYYGADSAKNAAFLRTLPAAIANTKPEATRPSLKEAIEMIPALKRQEGSLLADKRYTVFAVTFPNWDRCKDQNEAVAKLRESASQTKIRVLEVRLHK